MGFALKSIAGVHKDSWFRPEIEGRWSKTPPERIGLGMYKLRSTAIGVSKTLKKNSPHVLDDDLDVIEMPQSTMENQH